MAETVTSRKQGERYRTDRFKRPFVETEGSNGFNARNQDNYFERVSLLQFLVVIFGLVTLEILCFQTDSYPFELLGGAGKKLQYLTSNHMSTMRFVFILTVVIHLFETTYAHYQCRKANLTGSATIKWMVQTFIVGYGSLRMLNAYCEKKTMGKSK